MSAEAVSPGDALWRLIADEGLYIPRLMADCGLRPGELERLVLGYTRVTPMLAQRLEVGTGVPASRRLYLQSAFDQVKNERES